MTDEQTTDFQNKAHEMCSQLLDASRERLRSVELGSRIAPVQRRRDAEGATASEITIDFLGQGGIEDVLEFDIVKAGKPVATLDELRDWLASSLDDVVNRRMVLRKLPGG